MSSRSERIPRRLLAILVVPLMLLLTSCVKMDAEFTVHSDQTVDVHMTVQDKTGMATEDDMDCSGFSSEVGGDYDVTTEQVEVDGKLGCEITASRVPISEFQNDAQYGFTVEDDKVTVHMEGDESMSELGGMGDLGDLSELGDLGNLMGGMEPEISMTVNFPGKIVDYDGAVEISENTATWSGVEAFAQGGYVTAELSDNSLPGWLLWVLIGVAVVVVAAIVVLLVVLRKGRSSKQPPAAPGVPGHQQPYPGQPGAAQQPYPAQPGPQQPYQSAPAQQPPYQQAPGQQPYQPAPGQQPYQPGRPDAQPPYQQGPASH